MENLLQDKGSILFLFMRMIPRETKPETMDANQNLR